MRFLSRVAPFAGGVSAFAFGRMSVVGMPTAAWVALGLVLGSLLATGILSGVLED